MKPQQSRRRGTTTKNQSNQLPPETEPTINKHINGLQRRVANRRPEKKFNDFRALSLGASFGGFTEAIFFFSY